MPAYRHIFAISTALLLLLTIYLFQSDLPGTLSSTMSEGTPLPISISVAPDTSTSSILGAIKLRITLENTSPHEVSFLRWSSPVDPRAPALGVFKFVSTKTNELAPCLNMKINHRLPASGYFSSDDESVIHIPANGKIDTVLEFKEPEVALKKGEKYSVKADGRWMGVWVHDNDQAAKLSLDNGMKVGDFGSNEIVVNVPDQGGELRE